MRALKEKEMEIPLTKKEFCSANIIEMETGTNCPCGGDSGNGGWTVFRLKDHRGTDLEVAVNGNPPKKVNSVEIILCGDSECETFIDALQFALKALKYQKRMNKRLISLGSTPKAKLRLYSTGAKKGKGDAEK
jgi:hypothetical protein